MTASDYDIIVVGSGIVGATAALMLAQQTRLKIAVLESRNVFPVWQKEYYESRVSALSLASVQVFQSLQVWNEIVAKRVSPYYKMFVWDALSAGQIQFDCCEVAKPYLGYIVEDQVIRESLYSAFEKVATLDFIHPVELMTFERTPEKIQLTAVDGRAFRAKLIVAADGAHSWVRAKAGIAIHEEEYGHTAIVTTVKTTLPHQSTAWQRFLPTGPLAFLPLDDPHHCSIVWSALPQRADELMALSDDDFCQTLEQSIESKFGKILSLDKRYSFPLQMRHAMNYVQDHIALVGDAAHTVHPLAGLGVNLGIQDGASLVAVISEALEKNRDWSALHTLRCYERERKSDNTMALAGIGFIKRLFASDQKSIQDLRGVGLNLVDRTLLIKNIFARYALGERGSY